MNCCEKFFQLLATRHCKHQGKLDRNGSVHRRFACRPSCLHVHSRCRRVAPPSFSFRGGSVLFTSTSSQPFVAICVRAVMVLIGMIACKRVCTHLLHQKVYLCLNCVMGVFVMVANASSSYFGMLDSAAPLDLNLHCIDEL